MKKNSSKIFISCFMILIFNTVLAQQSKSNLVISGTLAHYLRSGGTSHIKGFYKYPVDPGLELLYQYRLGNGSFLSSGLTYQRGRIANYKETEDRFRFGEISIPILFKHDLIRSGKKNLFSTLGVSFGKMLHLDWERPTSSDEWFDVLGKYEEHYSEKNTFTDLLFDLGISFPASAKNTIAISPYVKYRVKDNWMGYYRDRQYYGIKISYQFNLKRNEKL